MLGQREGRLRGGGGGSSRLSWIHQSLQIAQSGVEIEEGQGGGQKIHLVLWMTRAHSQGDVGHKLRSLALVVPCVPRGWGGGAEEGGCHVCCGLTMAYKEAVRGRALWPGGGGGPARPECCDSCGLPPRPRRPSHPQGLGEGGGVKPLKMRDAGGETPHGCAWAWRAPPGDDDSGWRVTDNSWPVTTGRSLAAQGAPVP